MIQPSYVYRAKIVNVVDGDTVDLIVDKGFRSTFEDRFRFKDIDTPERWEEGYQEAKDFVNQYLGEWVVIRTDHDKRGGFNRWICEIFIGEGEHQESLNEVLLRKGLAKPYK